MKKSSDAVLDTVKAELDRFDELTPDEVDKLCRVLRSLKKEK